VHIYSKDCAVRIHQSAAPAEEADEFYNGVKFSEAAGWWVHRAEIHSRRQFFDEHRAGKNIWVIFWEWLWKPEINPSDLEGLPLPKEIIVYYLPIGSCEWKIVDDEISKVLTAAPIWHKYY
jgi:hypothetical protein